MFKNVLTEINSNSYPKRNKKFKEGITIKMKDQIQIKATKKRNRYKK